MSKSELKRKATLDPVGTAIYVAKLEQDKAMLVEALESSNLCMSLDSSTAYLVVTQHNQMVLEKVRGK